MAEPGGRAVERKLTVPVAPTTAMIGVKPLFSGRSLGEGETATFDVVVVAPDGKPLARKGLRYELLKVESRYQWYRQDGSWDYEPIKSTRRIADGTVDVAADKPGRIAVPVQWGRYRLDVSTGDPNGPLTSVPFDAGWYTEASADTPDMLEIALDKPRIPGWRHHDGRGHRAHGGKVLAQRHRRPADLIERDARRAGRVAIELQVAVGRDWGNGAYVVATLLRPLDVAAKRMPGRAIGVQWFSIDRKAKTLALDLKLPPLMRPNTTLRVPVEDRRARPARRPASSSPRSMSASSTSPTTSRRRRTTTISASADSPRISATSTAS